MPPILLFFAAQLLYGFVALGVLSHPAILQEAKHEVKSVLGVSSQLAQDTTPAEAPAPAASTPESQPPPPPPAAAPETPAPAQPPAETPAATEPPVAPPTETPTATGTPAVPSTETPAPVTTEQLTPTVSEAPTTTETPSPMPKASEASVVQTEAVLNPEDVITDTEHIDKQSVDEAEKEEDAIAQAQTPDQKATFLVTFAKDKVNDIENTIKKDDFASTIFATTRLTDQIDRATQEIQKAPAKEQQKLTQQVSDFCRQADLQLKNQQLSVPEEAEQDIEISRSKCLDYQ